VLKGAASFGRATWAKSAPPSRRYEMKTSYISGSPDARLLCTDEALSRDTAGPSRKLLGERMSSAWSSPVAVRSPIAKRIVRRCRAFETPRLVVRSSSVSVSRTRPVTRLSRNAALYERNGCFPTQAHTASIDHFMASSAVAEGAARAR
jgi:hypothetical protein